MLQGGFKANMFLKVYCGHLHRVYVCDVPRPEGDRPVTTTVSDAVAYPVLRNMAEGFTTLHCHTAAVFMVASTSRVYPTIYLMQTACRTPSNQILRQWVCQSGVYMMLILLRNNQTILRKEP